jgi:hypothetical protein
MLGQRFESARRLSIFFPCAGKTHGQQWTQLYVGIGPYLVVRSNSLVISMAGLMDTATGQLSS